MRKMFNLTRVTFAIVIVTLIVTPISYAIDKDFFAGNDIIIYDPTASSCPLSPSGGGGSIDQGAVGVFASEPITSTWNLSDNAAEQWFLKQANANATVGKYGLNAGNIGAITSAVKDAGVSPVFFYLYTVNEGGGAGGFINHYGSDVAGGGVANAKRDAEYLAKYASIMDSHPSWIDAGNPVDFVPNDVKTAGNANFQSMPSGTIGRVYIPATAAATWEVYYPNGLKASYNKIQDYGPPLSDAMKNISSMGGNPADGGAPISATSSGGCTTTVAGAGIQKAMNWAIMIAKNDGYGYDQPTRGTGWTKWQSDPNCASSCGNMDCSSFISAALTVAGYFKENPNFVTSTEGAALQKVGFTKVASSAHSSAGLQPGDILVSSGHTEMYIGNDQNVGAHINEHNGISGGAAGDQTGHEVSVGPFWDDDWIEVWRATK